MVGEWQRASTLRLDAGAGDRIVSLSDGRSMAVREYGGPHGAPVLALHGTPGSRLKFMGTGGMCDELGLRVIAPDRWGYGGTDAHPAPSLAAFADDAEALADRLGIQRFAVLGVSGGGPYAAALAATRPERVTALALVAPVGPIVGEVDDEITPFHRFCFGALARRPAAVGAVFQGFRAALAVSPALGMRLAMLRIAPADRDVLRRQEVATRLGRTFVEGLRPGVKGPVTDLGLFGAAWGIDPAAARAPTRLWLGTVDQNVPRSAARRLAARLPGCELVEIEGAGHMWIALNYRTVLQWIADKQKGAAIATPSAQTSGTARRPG